MVKLQPCTSCRRHVRGEECPFCGASTLAAESPDRAFVRVSRAMVFAGATLAAACGGTSRPQQPAAASTSTQEGPPPLTPPDASSETVAGPDPWASPPHPPPVDAGVVADAAAPQVVQQPDDSWQRNYQHHPCSTPDPKAVAAAQKRLKAAKTAEEKQRAQEELMRVQMPICAPYGAPPSRRRVV